MITEQDKLQIKEKGISEEMFGKQLERFKIGFPYLEVAATASTEKGIMALADEEVEKCINSWKSYLSLNRSVVKFVPASGAASRMFKDLYSFLDADYDVPTKDAEKEFFTKISNFAFFNTLDNVCKGNTGRTIAQLVELGQYKTIVENLLLKDGMNYGNLPKGLLEFHRYNDDDVRTPFEEHMQEGNRYACTAHDGVKIHFTVSNEHKELFQVLASEKQVEYATKYGVDYNISFSEQKPSTDTVAVDMDNNPFREEDGSLLFRPGGHGALIENLNDIDADIIFIKNIDNVSPDANKELEAKYKQVLAGALITTQNKIFEYLEIIDGTKYTHDDLIDMLYFIQNTLNIKLPNTKLLEDAELVLYIKRKLDRPCRACGMVANVGEPGGGPFIAVSGDGTRAPQILESSQIDMENEEAKAMFENGTHFNPVDLVCGIKDYRGQKFNLKDFVDVNTGFISYKSKDGKDLKALELPGLWNGAMSNWNTIFVEVPIKTFNPVKTVNDLLREQHQAGK